MSVIFSIFVLAFLTELRVGQNNGCITLRKGCKYNDLSTQICYDMEFLNFDGFSNIIYGYDNEAVFYSDYKFSGEILNLN